jgi:hypothetical protein
MVREQIRGIVDKSVKSEVLEAQRALVQADRKSVV